MLELYAPTLVRQHQQTRKRRYLNQFATLMPEQKIAQREILLKMITDALARLSGQDSLAGTGTQKRL